MTSGLGIGSATIVVVGILIGGIFILFYGKNYKNMNKKESIQ